MKFIENIEKDKYEEFVKNNGKAHFLQSYAWGEFSKKEKNLIPHYVGLVDDNEKIVAACLLLEKKLPFKQSYFYIPRGFIIDYSNLELLREFSLAIRDYAKKNKAIFFKIDPDIYYNVTSNSGEVIVDHDEQVINSLKEIGFRHLGFTKNFETMQPRYTFRIDMDKPWDEIKNSFSKTTNQRIKKAESLLVDVRVGTKDDIASFYNLMIMTENRKDFITHNEEYYRSLYEIWNTDNKCNLFIGSVNLDKMMNVNNNILDELKEELKNLPKSDLSKSEKTKKEQIDKRIEKINQDLTRYSNYRNEYGTEVILSAHFIIEYADKAWVLYAGNHNILADTYTNYLTYENHIKYYYDNGTKIYDQFGTIGDLRSDNPLIGLHEFKKKFGGDYVEFIGEFDFVTNKFMYFVFTKLVPFYRKLVKVLAKKKRGKQ